MTIHQLADLLGGTVNGCWINIAGPGHRPNDRSLGVRFHRSAPGGFWVRSFCGDDHAACRQYVKNLLQGAKCDCERPNIWDRAPLLLGTPTGTVDLETGLQRPADPEEFITRLTSIGPAPEGTPHPVFRNFWTT